MLRFGHAALGLLRRRALSAPSQRHAFGALQATVLAPQTFVYEDEQMLAGSEGTVAIERLKWVGGDRGYRTSKMGRNRVQTHDAKQWSRKLLSIER